MTEQKIRDHINASLRTKLETLLVPASMGLGFVLGACNSSTLNSTRNGLGGTSAVYPAGGSGAGGTAGLPGGGGGAYAASGGFTGGRGGAGGMGGARDGGPSDSGDAGDSGQVSKSETGDTSDALVSEAGFSKEVFFNE